MKFITVVSVLSLTLISACGKNNSGKSSNNRVSGMSNLEVSRPAQYVGKCRQLEAENTKLYQKTDFRITMTNVAQARFEFKTSVFVDKKCTSPLYQSSIDGDGTMTMNNTILKSDINRALIRPLLDEVAKAFNQNRLCGKTSWRAYVETDVTNTNCIQGSRRGDIHFKSKNNGSALTLYMCDEYQELNEKCEKISLSRLY